MLLNFTGKCCGMGVGSHGIMERKLRGILRINLAVLGCRVDPSLRTELLSLRPGHFYCFPYLYLSRFFISLEHPEEASKGTMASANSQLKKKNSAVFWLVF